MKFALSLTAFAGLFQSSFAGNGCGGQREGTSCDDGYKCTYDSRCNSVGECIGKLPEIDSHLSISYSGAPDIFDVYYAINPLNKPFNIGMQFAYDTYAASGDIADEQNMIPVDFAAIIFGGECGNSRSPILAEATTGADPVYASTYQALGTPVFEVLINTTNLEAPYLEIKTPFENFGPPFWDQNYPCTGLSTEGGFGTSPGDMSGPNFLETCGALTFCVEFQVLLCEKKIDFVDVNVKIELDIESQCEEDACGDVIMARAAPADAEGKFAADYPIRCVPCEPGSVNADGRPAQRVEQGDIMKVCIFFEDEDLEGACILEIEDLDLIIRDQRFPIVPTCFRPECIFPATEYINYAPGGTVYAHNNGYVFRTLTNDDATVSFQPPVWWYQEKTYKGGSIRGTLSGSVVLGFGCYCTGECSPRPANAPFRGRQLQEEGSLAMADISSEEWDFLLAGGAITEEPPASPTSDDGCSLSSLMG